MVIPIGVCTPTGPQRGARNPHTLFRVRFSWASLFRWYALKNARVPPAIVLSRLRRGENGAFLGRSAAGIASSAITKNHLRVLIEVLFQQACEPPRYPFQ